MLENLPYPIWPGSASAAEVTQFTSFKFYDNDSQFVSDCVKSIEWAARRLGYPVIDIELTNENFVNMFEEAVSQYGAIVNAQNIKEYMLIVQGSPDNVNLTGRLIRGGIGRIIELANSYGTEIGVGGDTDWKHTYIDVTASVQTYNLDELLSDKFESGNRITIRRIFHFRKPASMRFLDELSIAVGMGSLGAGVPTTFYYSGFGERAYLLSPLYEDVLRMQAIEMNDQFRRSSYSFELINNKLRIFPIPTTNFRLWIDYTVSKDSNIGYISGSDLNNNDTGLGKITDQSNIPYQPLIYSKINSVGRIWIRDYFLALCKITLGTIRGKYSNIPIPGDQITLDGESLKQEGINERDKLIERLVDMLEKSGKKAQILNKQEEEESIKKIMNSIPLGIYVK